jgi:hypothetical protein
MWMDRHKSPAVSRIGNYINDVLIYICVRNKIDAMKKKKKFINTNIA